MWPGVEHLAGTGKVAALGAHVDSTSAQLGQATPLVHTLKDIAMTYYPDNQRATVRAHDLAHALSKVVPQPHSKCLRSPTGVPSTLTLMGTDGVFLGLPMVINGHRCHDVIGSLNTENDLTVLGEDHEVDLELLKPAVTAQAVTLQGTYYTVVYYIQPVSMHLTVSLRG